MRAIKMNWARFGVAGAFALALATQALPAKAEGVENFWAQVMHDEAAQKAQVILPSHVRAVRTPSKPVKPAPPIGISASAGSLFYQKPHKKDPVMLFEITLSRAPGSTPLTVDFATVGNTPLATSEFEEVSGLATFSGNQKVFKVYVPILALTKTKGNVLSLELSDPSSNGAISKAKGNAPLVGKPVIH